MQAARVGQSRSGLSGARWASPSRSLVVGLVVSVVAHWVLVRAVPLRSASARSALPVEIDRSRPITPGDEPGEVGGLRRDHAALTPGGSTSRANVDALRVGGGGDATGAYEVVLLVTDSAPITLVDAPLNAADRSQVQRIDTASDRASWDSRRATPNPDDDAFLASGAGDHRERRALATEDAQEGARVAPSSTVRGDVEVGEGEAGGHGANEGRSAEVMESATSSVGTALPSQGGSRGRALGTERASPGVGIVGGQGRVETARAAVATGRPSIDPGPAATVAEREGRVRDDTDAELLAAQMFESRADASRRAGAQQGQGRGGTAGTPGEGSGGARGVGGSASPYGPGTGAFAALDTSDARYRTWLLAQRRRIEDRLVFPRTRQLARDQGTSVVRLVVRRDGTIATAPRVIRSSGFDDLDDAALLAVRDSLPFAAVPEDLAVGQSQITVTLPIEFANPMTH